MSLPHPQDPTMARRISGKEAAGYYYLRMDISDYFVEKLVGSIPTQLLGQVS